MSTVLFRRDSSNRDEFEVCRQYFKVIERRTEFMRLDPSRTPACDVRVIPRYSLLPFPKELQDDIANLGGRLIQSYEQHCYIANFDYYWDIQEFTPKTYFRFQDVYSDNYNGPLIVKGRTNSRKAQWNKSFYAQNRLAAAEIATELSADGLIGYQELIYRQYVPLKVFDYGLYGLPYSNEYRFFYYKDCLLAGGYYWSTAPDWVVERCREVPSEAIEFAGQVAKIVERKVNFFVVDVAETTEGSWIVIEINDGSMSGLSECDPHQLYDNLRSCLG
jgi:hypothetical protein